MSIKKKLPILFTILVLFILIANNTHHYIRSKNSLLENYNREIALLAEQVSYQVENANEGAQYVEDIIGRELRTASIAIRNSLPPSHEDVTNEQLEKLAAELMVSHITLLKKTEDDIVGIKSSDPHEIDMGTKGWGYWYDAFEQLFAQEPVDVNYGLTLKDYWSGPIEVASSNPDHTDKWGYFYDGSTDYIINPYLRDNEVLDYEKRFGPTNVMNKITEHFEGVLELTVFNPKNFGEEDEVVHLNGNRYVRLSAQPIWYGTYDFKNVKKDKEFINSVLKSRETEIYDETINGQEVKKAFVPIDADTDEPYVIGLTYDHNIIQNALNDELANYVVTSMIFMIMVLIFSFIFSNSITKPIALIVEHVNDLAQGNFGKKIKLHRKDELGNLACNVNTLSDELKTYTDELRESQELVKFQAYHDPLTLLPNRRYIQKKLKSMLHDASLNNRVLAVIFMDIDRFKHINDSMGHKMGDKLIKLISERIKESLMPYGCEIARQGGDEFIILMKDMNEEQVEEITKDLIMHVKSPYKLGDREIYVGASCGISFYPRHSENMEELIVNADMAMYSAKKNGGNRVTVFDLKENHSMRDTVHIEAGLRKAILDESLEVAYQPKVNAVTGKIIGAEALVRWKEKEMGNVSPALFIPIAEDTGLIQSLFEVVLRKSIKQMKEWNNGLEEPLSVSVNVSAVQFLDSILLVDSVKAALDEFDFPAQQLEIEITESALLNNMNDTIEALEKLHALGVAISVDDFGTGYSSLTYLKRLPIDTLKIDQSFIRDIGFDWSNTEIASAIIHLARSLKLGIIAEGVEEEHQKEFLIENDCPVMQGYLFYKPLGNDAFQEVIDKV
ncbi:putative bifunctional diguanylate cyclase/phosphodiesterase [Robertmurraya massiliosenegalensis]|uniref:putative bifunctional diguanylate cyclase/phosphodiesterase n=1 Tax=Robertmurraya massiliosenegalensis TaxID=1287657 RepID=UPI0002F8D6E8|nr:EAL domain-containing protein [Robertmurraya massiliosenegalensis]